MTSNRSAPGAAFDRPLRSVEHDLIALDADVERSVECPGAESIVRHRFGEAPGGGRAAGDQRRDRVRVCTATASAQDRCDDVRRHRRAGRGMAAELVRDEREVDETVLTDRSPTVGLADEKARPPEFGATYQ